jgi:hypothetical protein
VGTRCRRAILWPLVSHATSRPHPLRSNLRYGAGGALLISSAIGLPCAGATWRSHARCASRSQS